MSSDKLQVDIVKLDGKGGFKTLAISDAGKADWIHFHGSVSDVTRWLKKNYKLEPEEYELLNMRMQRSKLKFNKTSAMIALKVIRSGKFAEMDIRPFRFFIKNDVLFTICQHSSKTIVNIKKDIVEKRGAHNSHDLTIDLMNNVSRNIEKCIVYYDNIITQLEKKISKGDSNESVYSKIGKIRNKILILRYNLLPQKLVFDKLCNLEDHIFHSKARQSFEEIGSFMQGYIDSIDVMRDRCQNLQNEIFNLTADRTNKHVYILSIISAIFLPSMFLTGLFGVNLAGIWGAEYEDSFTVYSVILCIFIILGVYIFKKLKWF